MHGLRILVQVETSHIRCRWNTYHKFKEELHSTCPAYGDTGMNLETKLEILPFMSLYRTVSLLDNES